MHKKYQLTISIEDVIKSLCANHRVVNKALVRKAFQYASNNHKGQKRKTNEPYIMHPLRVAKMIADWGFDSKVVAAALLHDIVEDCHTSLDEITREFNSDISAIVNTLTSVNKELKQAEGLSKEDIDRLSDARLLMTMSEQALFIKIADRIDNLRTIEIMPESKQFGKAWHTREILLPYVMKEGAFELVDILEELCFQIEHRERYNEICTRYDELRYSNSIATKQCIELFKSTFTSGSKTPLPKDLQPYQSCITDFRCNPRSIISIFRQLSRQASNLDKELPQLLVKKNVALYDMTLLIDADALPDNTTPIDVFFEYFKAIFSNYNICITACNQYTSHKDSQYFVLQDEMENIYRLFIRSNEDYLRYKLGHVVDADSSISLSDIDEIEPRDSFNKKIKVFKKDGSEMYIDAGATMLDFAFAIHSEIGLHFAYALIDSSKTKVPAYVRLNEGDKITIVTSEESTANIYWFRYLKTNKAIQHLIRHLQASA